MISEKCEKFYIGMEKNIAGASRGAHWKGVQEVQKTDKAPFFFIHSIVTYKRND